VPPCRLLIFSKDILIKHENHPQNNLLYQLYLLLYMITTILQTLTSTMDNFMKELLTLFLLPSPDSPYQLYASFTTEKLELIPPYVPDLLMKSTWKSEVCSSYVQ